MAFRCAYRSRFAEQKYPLPLQELEILEIFERPRGSATEDLPTPALKKLRITSAPTSNHDFQFDDVLPALRELCCPLFLLPSLVPGQPISSIEITASLLREISDIQSLFKKTSTLKFVHSASLFLSTYTREFPFGSVFRS